MFEFFSMIFSIPNSPTCWLWMAVVESNVSFCAEITTVILIYFSKSFAQKSFTVDLRLLHKYGLKGPNLIFLKEMGVLPLHFIRRGESVSSLSPFPPTVLGLHINTT